MDIQNAGSSFITKLCNDFIFNNIKQTHSSKSLLYNQLKHVLQFKSTDKDKDFKLKVQTKPNRTMYTCEHTVASPPKY